MSFLLFMFGGRGLFYHARYDIFPFFHSVFFTFFLEEPIKGSTAFPNKRQKRVGSWAKR
jgi:hypothetical protein